MSHRRLALGIALLACAAVSARAQEPDESTPLGIVPGRPAGSYPLSGIDSVNLFNGNLVFRLPLLDLGGRGDLRHVVGLTIQQRWGVRVGEHFGTIPRFNWWRGIRPGYGPGTVRVFRSGIASTLLTRMTFTESDETQHELRDVASDGRLGSRSRGQLFRTYDGTAISFLSDSPIEDTGAIPSAKGTLLFPDGMEYGVEDGLVRWMRDRNGNFMEFGYLPSVPERGPQVGLIKDALGRIVTFTYASDTDPNDRIKFKGYEGVERTIVISYAPLRNALISTDPIQTYGQLFPGFNWSSIYRDSDFNPLVVSGVTLPNQGSYTFQYSRYGELARVFLPTGGIFAYAHAAGLGGPGAGIVGEQIYRRVTQRSVYVDGSERQRIEYGPEQADGAGQLIEITHRDPPANPDLPPVVSRERHYFHHRASAQLADNLSYPPWDAGRERKVEVLSASDRVLQDKTSDWNQLPLTWSATALNEPRVIETTTGTYGPASLVQARTAFEHEVVVSPQTGAARYNNLTDVREYGFDDVLMRRRHRDYVTTDPYVQDAHLLRLPLTEYVYEGESALRARTTYVYDAYPVLERTNISGRAPQEAHGPGYVTRGNVTAVTRWLDTTGEDLPTLRHYDMAGNRISEEDPRGNITQFDFDDRFGGPNGEARSNQPPVELGSSLRSFAFPSAVTNAASHTTYTQVDYYLGQPVDREDANGVVASATYADLLDRPRAVFTAQERPENSRTRFTYRDAPPNPSVDIDADRDTLMDARLHRTISYDGLGRELSKLTFERPEPTAFISSDGKNYDARGRVSIDYIPLRPGDIVYGTSTTYDALDRPTQALMPGQAALRTAYDANLTTVTDPSGRQRLSITDALGRVVNVIEDPGPPPHLNLLTTYAYNVFDQLIFVDQSGQRRSYAYDSLQRLICSSMPESRVGSIACTFPLPTSDVDLFRYDRSGNLAERRDARGRVTTLEYDSLDRVRAKTYNDGTPNVTYTYDAPGVPFSKGRPTRIASSVAATGFDEYDAAGRVRRSHQEVNLPSGVQSYPVSYTYDLAGNLKSETYPSGRVITTAYDDAGRFQKVSQGSLDYGRVPTDPADPGYSAHGGLMKMQLGNGRWQHMRYNCRLQPRQAGLGSSPSSVEFLNIGFDYGTNSSCGTTPTSALNNGNVLSQTINVTVPPGGTFNQIYSYDGVNRLQTAVESTIAGQTTWSQTYDYDEFGNRAVRQGLVLQPGLTPTALTQYDRETNRILASEYDRAGNQTRDATGRIFTYDAENRQVTAGTASSTASYGYDGDGRRVTRRVSGATTVFVYDAFGKLLAEYGGAPGIDLLYVTPDVLGSTRIATDRQGAVRYRADYLPFGEEIPATYSGRSTIPGYGTDPGVRQKFTGKERDFESGLDFFQARYFSAAPGRFTGADPEIEWRNNVPSPQRWNRYAYGMNNPLRYVDPDGRDAAETTAFAREMYALRQARGPEVEAMVRAEYAKGNDRGLVAGLALATVAFAPELIVLARALWPTIAVTAANPRVQEVALDILESATGAPSSRLPFSSGDVIRREYQTAKGVVDVMAEAVIEGKTLHLKDVAVYPQSAKALRIGSVGVLDIRRQLADEARRLGFERLKITGLRLSGAKPGKTPDVIIDLLKIR